MSRSCKKSGKLGGKCFCDENRVVHCVLEVLRKVPYSKHVPDLLTYTDANVYQRFNYLATTLILPFSLAYTWHEQYTYCFLQRSALLTFRGYNNTNITIADVRQQ